ncbi:unnamed protein product [Chrysoparadoxa australica]
MRAFGNLAVLCTLCGCQAFMTAPTAPLLPSCTALQAQDASQEGVTRREAILASGVAAFSIAGAAGLSPPAEAIGPIKIALESPTYQAVACPPGQRVPGQKAGAGLKPVCVEVIASTDNPQKKTIIDAGVYGFVFDDEGTSVVANNPDGGSDAGQFAIIPEIPPGEGKVKFQFIAAIPPSEELSDKKLKFKSLKAISYPGGEKYGAIDECEMNPLADGCDFD